MNELPYSWHDGKIIEGRPNIDSFNWSLHYGGNCWEGIRSYVGVDGETRIFMLYPHIRRLFESAKILKLRIPYSVEEIMLACVELVKKVGGGHLYIRPIVYYVGHAESTKEENLTISVDILVAKIDSSSRMNLKVITSNKIRSYPEHLMQCKTVNNYGQLRLYSDEAKRAKVDDVLLKDHNGYYTEASSANLFIIKDGVAYTPPNNGSILSGVTRKLLMDVLPNVFETPVIEKQLTFPDLVTAHEVFLSGTFVEIQQIIDIDGYDVERKNHPLLVFEIMKYYRQLTTYYTLRKGVVYGLDAGL